MPEWALQFFDERRQQRLQPTEFTHTAVIKASRVPKQTSQYSAILSMAFSSELWTVMDPVDVLTDPDFNLLNPFFMVVVLGLILNNVLDWEAWRKTEGGLALGILLGPFLSLGSVPVRLMRLIRRIGIWESHGGQDRSCRLIDDGLEGDQNRPSVLMWRPGSLTRSHQCM